MDYMMIMALLRMIYEKPLSLTRLPNGYCGDHDSSGCDICKQRPWWQVELENVGKITIGWRKRVIEIDWKETGISVDATKDDVTKEAYMVHAWGYAKALEYLEFIIHTIRCERRDAERIANGEKCHRCGHPYHSYMTECVNVAPST